MVTNPPASTLKETRVKAEDGDDISYGKIFGALLMRWHWVAGSIVICVAGSLLLAIREKPTYSSSMQLIVEPNFEQRLDLENLDAQPQQNNQLNAIDYATQLSIMRSEKFVNEVLERLSEEYPNLTREEIDKNFRLIRLEEGDTQTRIFQASYKSENPLLPSRFLEELKEVYLNYNETRQRERLSRGLDYINRQLDATRVNLELSQGALENFRESTRIISPSEQSDQLIQTLNSLSLERRQLEADLSEIQSRYINLQEKLQLTPSAALVASRLSQSRPVQDLIGELQVTELELIESRVAFTENHPSNKRLEEEYQRQQTLLDQLISEIVDEPIRGSSQQLEAYSQLSDVDISLIEEFLQVSTSLAGLTSRINSLQLYEQELEVQLTEYPALIAEYDRLQPEIDIERATLQRLLAQREQLTSELAKEGYIWQVIEEPSLGEVSESSLKQQILLGIIGGLFIGGITAFALSSMDSRIRDPKDLERAAFIPLLGTMLHVPSLNSSRPTVKSIIRAANVFGALSEEDGELTSLNIAAITSDIFQDSMALMGSSICFQLMQRGIKSLAVTSSLPEEGKTTMTLGFAYTLARMSYRVVVLDADLNQSKLMKTFNLASAQTLTEFLNSDDAYPRLSNLKIGDLSIDIMPAGTAAIDSLRVLSSTKFKDLIAHLDEKYDFVLVDTTPILSSADAVKIGGVCDSTVLVCKLGHVTEEHLENALAFIDSVNVLGMVANE